MLFNFVVLSDFRIILVFVILLLEVVYSKAEEEIKEADDREKRQVNGLPLVYPYGGTYKVFYYKK